MPIRSLYPPQVCLTDGAKDECNVVEVIGRNHKNQEITVPVANLKLSCQPLVRAPAGIWWRGRSSVACAKECVISANNDRLVGLIQGAGKARYGGWR